MFALVSASSFSGCSSENPQSPYFALQPLGKLDDGFLVLMSRFIETVYARPCAVLKSFELPSAAYDAGRKQYQASQLLLSLRDRSPAGASKVMGVTEKDIYTRQMNFIFGLADMRGQFCVVSTARLHESFWGKPEKADLLHRRTFMVLYHELGHTFGMSHCDKPRCAMCYHNSLPELDASYVWFCPECTRELEKRFSGFPEDRDAKIAALLTDLGLVKDAELYTTRKGPTR